MHIGNMHYEKLWNRLERGNYATSGRQILFFLIFSEKFALGTPLPSLQGLKAETCNFVIYSKHRKTGEIMTPTYPGTYPKDIHCSYKFVGKKLYFLQLTRNN